MSITSAADLLHPFFRFHIEAKRFVSSIEKHTSNIKQMKWRRVFLLFFHIQAFKFHVLIQFTRSLKPRSKR